MEVKCGRRLCVTGCVGSVRFLSGLDWDHTYVGCGSLIMKIFKC